MESGQSYIAGTRQQTNGHVGEDRTSGLLGSYFWLLRRNADFDGADFLLQTVVSSIEEERSRRSEIMATGVIQAKFFEGKNGVKVRRDYAEEAGQPRIEFFLLAHTNGEHGKHHHYFLTAQDIAKLSLSEDGEFRVFRVTGNNRFEHLKDTAPDTIASVIHKHLAQVELQMNQMFLRRAFFSYRTSHSVFDANVQSAYYLDIFKGTPIVTVKDEGEKEETARLIELRRDFYPCWGEFSWGYRGTGPSFLAVCILAHHFGGEAPSDEQRRLVVDKLISQLNSVQSHVITTRQLQALVGGRTITPSI